jgi:hypothetical protein
MQLLSGAKSSFIAGLSSCRCMTEPSSVKKFGLELANTFTVGISIKITITIDISIEYNYVYYYI